MIAYIVDTKQGFNKNEFRRIGIYLISKQQDCCGKKVSTIIVTKDGLSNPQYKTIVEELVVHNRPDNTNVIYLCHEKSHTEKRKKEDEDKDYELTSENKSSYEDKLREMAGHSECGEVEFYRRREEAIKIYEEYIKDLAINLNISEEESRKKIEQLYAAADGVSLEEWCKKFPIETSNISMGYPLCKEDEYKLPEEYNDINIIPDELLPKELDKYITREDVESLGFSRDRVMSKVMIELSGPYNKHNKEIRDINKNDMRLTYWICFEPYDYNNFMLSKGKKKTEPKLPYVRLMKRISEKELTTKYKNTGLVWKPIFEGHIRTKEDSELIMQQVRIE